MVLQTSPKLFVLQGEQQTLLISPFKYDSLCENNLHWLMHLLSQQMFVECMLMTGTVVNMKNEIITAPLFLKFIVREREG